MEEGTCHNGKTVTAIAALSRAELLQSGVKEVETSDKVALVGAAR